jgi:acyl carrier protein phosphodiesterase
VPALIGSKLRMTIVYGTNKNVHGLKIRNFEGMNYLAHSFLSNHNEGLLIGNFIADHVSGNHFENYTPEVIEGIRMHRRIDAFTDSHVKFQESKRFFYKGFEKYSGILVDIYFDHLLAKNFSIYSPAPLSDYCLRVYNVYTKNQQLLPESSVGFLNYVLQNNVYFSYSTEQGIERVLYHLSHRIKHGVFLNESITIFRENLPQLEENFRLFFRDAIREFHPGDIIS